MDPGEQGLGGVTVTLSGLGVAGDVISGVSTTTASDGSYHFTNLPVGTYSVTETPPAGYIHGQNASGALLIPNSSTSNTISNITVNSNADTGMNVFGQILPVQMYGSVYDDKNGSGVFDAGDTPISGVTLTLYDLSTNQPIAVTDDRGERHHTASPWTAMAT